VVDVVIRAFGEEEWQVLRRVRLTALADSPGAFGSTLAAEEAFDEARWRSRTSSMIAALAGDEAVGLAGSFVDPAAPDVVELVAMWVSASRRGAGIGRALVEAVVDRAARTGAREVGLWVTVGNDAAARLYERCGFRSTGARVPLPSDPALEEERMVRPLG
jgi:ribosomal protein S18 acetylase RimI-like enzyme